LDFEGAIAGRGRKAELEIRGSKAQLIAARAWRNWQTCRT
jgi:hypothetical protein